VTTNKRKDIYLTQWKPASLWQRLKISHQEKHWLLEEKSLTAKFKKQCPNLTVEILSEKWQAPLSYEKQQLGLKDNQHAWTRCIVLKCGQQNILYARTVIPNLTSGNTWFAIKKLGNKPLGEVLFNLKNITRSPFKILKRNYPWQYLEQNTIAAARYSLFKQDNQPLLLTEVFLLKI